jgi:hypothetical protein
MYVYMYNGPCIDTQNYSELITTIWQYVVCLTSINVQKKILKIQFSNQHFFAGCILIYDIYEL